MSFFYLQNEVFNSFIKFMLDGTISFEQAWVIVVQWHDMWHAVSFTGMFKHDEGFIYNISMLN